jgi:hypothetical protein
MGFVWWEEALFMDETLATATSPLPSPNPGRNFFEITKSCPDS